ncbi:Os04g0206100, partial [Oryza sativa Japonica Group]
MTSTAHGCEKNAAAGTPAPRATRPAHGRCGSYTSTRGGLPASASERRRARSVSEPTSASRRVYSLASPQAAMPPESKPSEMAATRKGAGGGGRVERTWRVVTSVGRRPWCAARWRPSCRIGLTWPCASGKARRKIWPPPP